MIKTIYNLILITILFGNINSVYAVNLSTELSESKSHFSFSLNSGESLTVKYNLAKEKITRADEWYTYVVQCEANNRIEIDYIGNFKNRQFKGLMWIASDHQSDQLIGDLIDSQGVFTIQNIGQDGQALEVQCQLHPKFQIDVY